MGDKSLTRAHPVAGAEVAVEAAEGASVSVSRARRPRQSAAHLPGAAAEPVKVLRQRVTDREMSTEGKNRDVRALSRGPLSACNPITALTDRVAFPTRQ